ncbi:MAG: 50S ribosomal protein L11 methyltransferase [Leptospirales bacterium]|nr:50S ribosomal protein L11 methyltransferase [Leptospirales bacterium]
MSDEIFSEVIVRLPAENSLLLVQALDQGGALPELSGYYETLYQEDRPADDQTQLSLFFPVSFELPEIQVELLLVALGIDRYAIESQRVQRQDYLEAYKEHYQPFHLTRRIFITPSWERGGQAEQQARCSGSIPLYLDPGLAFGTGKHPTTQLCAACIEELTGPGIRFIDAGAGSGILSLVALLLGAEAGLAFDIDGNAALSIRQNLEANCPPLQSEQLQIVCGDFTSSAFENFSADWLFANITAAGILQNIDAIERGSFSRMMLSGILSEKAEQVLQAFQSNWRSLDARHLDGWSLLLLERRS